MSLKQSRKSFSVRGVTYAAVRLDCAARRLSMSDYIEGLIAADRKARGLSDTAIATAVAAVERQGDRHVGVAPRAVHAATAAPPLPRSAATTAELRLLITEEANRLIPRLPPGTSAEDLEVVGRAAAVEAVRIFDPSKGVRLVDAARPLVRRTMADRLRDLREESTAAPAPTATATASPAPPKSALVVATAAAATTTATGPRRPVFYGNSTARQIWEWLERHGRPTRPAEAAAAVGCEVGAVWAALGRWSAANFVARVDAGYQIVASHAHAPASASFPAPSCPCCGGKPLGLGMRCGPCALACRPDGAGGWRRGDQCPAAPATEAPPSAPLPAVSSIKVGPPPEQTAFLGREETPARTFEPSARGRSHPAVRTEQGCPPSVADAEFAARKLTSAPDESSSGGAALRQRQPAAAAPQKLPMTRAERVPRGHSVPAVDPVDFEADVEDDEIEERPPLRRAPAGFRPALCPPPPIPEGRNAVSQGRPAGARVEPAKQRTVEDTRKIVKVDPIAAVHAGRAGVQF